MSEFNARRARPDELKPCPFCGSSDISNVSAGFAGPTNAWHLGDEIFAVNCRDCGASVPNRYRNDLVVEAWNRRAAIEKAEGRS
jgi:Lar family restriction alleviation protein